jgi:hypothetical protein
VIDIGAGNRAAVVAAIRQAASEWGFFQVTGHGVPQAAMAAAVGAVRGFHESAGGEGSEKARLYSREPARAVKYHCNFDLYQSPVANWRDTLYLRIAPDPPDAGDLPETCRSVLSALYARLQLLISKMNIQYFSCDVQSCQNLFFREPAGELRVIVLSLPKKKLIQFMR